MLHPVVIHLVSLDVAEADVTFHAFIPLTKESRHTSQMLHAVVAPSAKA